MSIGQKGMLVAAKTLALSAVDLLIDPEQLRLAKDSFRQRLGSDVYRTRMPENHAPPLNYRDR